MVLLLEFGSTVQFTALCALEEEEVELAVDVRHRSLQGVAGTREDAQRPCQPLVVGKEIGTRDAVAEVQFPEHQRKADSGKPQVAAHAVQDASQAGILLGHASQLTVGTVKGVGPGDEQHTYPVEPSQMRLMEIKHNATGNTHKDAGDSDGIRTHAQFLEQLGPQEAKGTMEMQVEPLLGVRRLERSLIFFS